MNKLILIILLVSLLAITNVMAVNDLTVTYGTGCGNASSVEVNPPIEILGSNFAPGVYSWSVENYEVNYYYINSEGFGRKAYEHAGLMASGVYTVNDSGSFCLSTGYFGPGYVKVTFGDVHVNYFRNTEPYHGLSFSNIPDCDIYDLNNSYYSDRCPHISGTYGSVTEINFHGDNGCYTDPTNAVITGFSVPPIPGCFGDANYSNLCVASNGATVELDFSQTWRPDYYYKPYYIIWEHYEQASNQMQSDWGSSYVRESSPSGWYISKAPIFFHPSSPGKINITLNLNKVTDNVYGSTLCDGMAIRNIHIELGGDSDSVASYNSRVPGDESICHQGYTIITGQAVDNDSNSIEDVVPYKVTCQHNGVNTTLGALSGYWINVIEFPKILCDANDPVWFNVDWHGQTGYAQGNVVYEPDHCGTRLDMNITIPSEAPILSQVPEFGIIGEIIAIIGLITGVLIIKKK